MEWVLKACDLNKDVEIDDKAQLTLPDIQLKYADTVFRQYVKCLHDKAVYRSEESLTLNLPLLPEALDNIRHPYKSIVNDIEQIKNQLGKIERTVCNGSKHMILRSPGDPECSHNHTCSIAEKSYHWGVKFYTTKQS